MALCPGRTIIYCNSDGVRLKEREGEVMWCIMALVCPPAPTPPIKDNSWLIIAVEWEVGNRRFYIYREPYLLGMSHRALICDERCEDRKDVTSFQWTVCRYNSLMFEFISNCIGS